MDDRESMVRWQGYAREQRSAVNSLFLTYAAALLGLEATILLNKEVVRIQHPWFFIAAGLGALISLAVGCIVVLVRLRDARLTARIARFRVERRASEADALRGTTDFLGKWTNGLLPAQVGLFVLAALAFLTWLVLVFGTKLI